MSPVAWQYCQTLYAIAEPTWCCRWEWSGSQRPERGLRCSDWVSSRPSLPLCHGYIAPAEPRVGRRPARRRQPPVPVGQQGPGDLGEVQVQIGQHEQLVPEDVTAVRLAVQAAGGHADVQVGGVRREGLQQVEQVQPQRAARSRPARPAPRCATAAARPRGGSPAARRSPARAAPGRSAAPSGSPIAGSREVCRATVLSTVTGSPARAPGSRQQLGRGRRTERPPEAAGAAADDPGARREWPPRCRRRWYGSAARRCRVPRRRCGTRSGAGRPGRGTARHRRC